MVRLAPSRPTPSPTDGLPLPLQSALNSLNVQVEQELARYRQSRRGEIPEARSGWMKGRPSLKLISVPAKTTPSPVPPATPSPAESIPVTTPESPTVIPGTPEVIREPRTALVQTPLGIGLLLLLGVGGVGLGIAAANPATLSPLLTRLAPYWPTWKPSPEVTTTEADTSEDEADTVAKAGSWPRSTLEPDLARQEFTPLDLSSLSTLPNQLRTRPIPGPLSVEVDPVETAVPAAIAPPTATAPSAPSTPTASPAPSERLATASPTPTVSPRSPAPTPTPAAPRTTAPATSSPPSSGQRPTPPASSASPTPAPPRFFYVVTDFTGDASLDQARQVVGDAYVRNFPIGARIQVGAFSSQSEAAAAAERLQREGLSVEVYQP